MSMRKTGWIATIAAGVVLAGGGAWGATTLASQPAAESETRIITPAPEASATSEVTPTPSVEVTPEATPTPTPEAVETPVPVVTEGRASERDPRAAELQAGLAGWGITTYSDAEVIAAADQVCAELAAGASSYDIVALPGEGQAVDGEFVYTAKTSYC